MYIQDDISNCLISMQKLRPIYKTWTIFKHQRFLIFNRRIKIWRDGAKIEDIQTSQSDSEKLSEIFPDFDKIEDM